MTIDEFIKTIKVGDLITIDGRYKFDRKSKKYLPPELQKFIVTEIDSVTKKILFKPFYDEE